MERGVHSSPSSVRMRAVRKWQRWKHRVIIAFCLWHMTAVTAFVLHVPQNPAFAPAIARAKAITEPYVYGLTQWQYWNIFAPDPLQRSSVYRIERMAEDGSWMTVRFIDYEHLAWYERAKELKILENLEDGWQVLVPSYLREYCATGGGTLRLVAEYFVLPTNLGMLIHSAAAELPLSERVLGSTTCEA